MNLFLLPFCSKMRLFYILFYFLKKREIKRPPVENLSMGLKTTLQTPFHNADKGQKRTLLGDRSIVTGCTVGLLMVAASADERGIATDDCVA